MGKTLLLFIALTAISGGTSIRMEATVNDFIEIYVNDSGVHATCTNGCYVTLEKSKEGYLYTATIKY